MRWLAARPTSTRLGGPGSLALAATLVLAPASPASAQKGLDDFTMMGWSLSNLRVGVVAAPDYMGSDDYRLRPSGSLALYRRRTGPAYGAPDDGVSLGLAGGRRVSFGVSSRLRSGRHDQGDLKGFEKIDWAVEAGGFVNWWPAEWIRVRGEVRHGFNGHDGWVADLGADVIGREGPWALSAGPRLTWGDEAFTRAYFSVSPLEAARSPFGIAPYTPRHGSTAAGVVGTAEYRLNRRWSLVGFVNYRRLMGDAADSPIVEDLGSRDQFSTTLGVRYWFGP